MSLTAGAPDPVGAAKVTAAELTRLCPEDYTVGWLCALTKEQTAAIALLDQRHSNIPFARASNDTNAYTLGSMSNHNVVIACLPKGKIGLAEAANAAAHMVTAFPSIKIGLMVGIGGGIPSNNVRLGDVVVSTPTETYPGVVQWDFGRAREGGRFQRIGALNSPPNFLLTALTKMESQHQMEGSKIAYFLRELQLKWPKLDPAYHGSSSLQDILFEADCDHIDVENTTSDGEDARSFCRKCDKSKTTERRSAETRVHYGMIASGNQVIKSGMFRDQLNRDLGGNVLCVEMEAGGLMSNFPCLVIRGICDYADSHKNKAWQEYAASVAAALAKEFLCYVEQGAIKDERSARDVLGHLCDKITTAGSDIKHVRVFINHQEREKVLRWLSPLESGKQQSEICQDGTGEWFLISKSFQEWLKSGRGTLFCAGIPGSGKTVIASIVVNYLMEKCRQDRYVGLGFFYFNHQSRNELNLQFLLANLLQQLCQNLDALPDSLKDLYGRHAFFKTRPSVQELEKTLISISFLKREVYFIIDALDECDSLHRSELLPCLSRIQSEAQVCIMYTSRTCTPQDLFFFNCFTQYISARRDDVEIFIDSRLGRALTNIPEDPRLEYDLKIKIMELVDGMFLIAQLCLDAFHQKTTAAEVRQVLLDLEGQRQGSQPNDEQHGVLYNAYEQAMSRIMEQSFEFRQLGMKTLAWVLLAERPLAAQELQHALAIQEGDSDLDSGNLRTIETIISACAGLVTRDAESNIVRLVHATTQEYLQSKQHVYFPTAEMDIASACATYFCFGGLSWQYSVRIGARPKEGTEPYDAFLPYVANNWHRHAMRAPRVPESVINLLADRERGRLAALCYEAYVRVSDEQTLDLALYQYGFEQEDDMGAASLHLALLFKFLGVAETLINLNSYNVVRPEFAHKGVTPLMFASKRGFANIVRLLLQKGAKTNVVGVDGRTALMYAVGSGHESVVELLLSCRARVDVKLHQRTCLHDAVLKGNVAMARLLLDHGAKVDGDWNPIPFIFDNDHSKHYYDRRYDREGDWTPLCDARKADHKEMVKLLLERGANLERAVQAEKDLVNRHLRRNAAQQTSKSPKHDGPSSLIPPDASEETEFQHKTFWRRLLNKPLFSIR